MNKTGENPSPGSLPLVILPLHVWNEGNQGTIFSIDLCLSLYPCFLKLGFPGGSDSKESACDTGGQGSIPELGRYPGEGNGNPLQYSCLDQGTWWTTVHEATKGETEQQQPVLILDPCYLI